MNCHYNQRQVHYGEDETGVHWPGTLPVGLGQLTSEFPTSASPALRFKHEL